MLPSYISCLLFTLEVALGAIDQVSVSIKRRSVENQDPLNEWGTYYSFPGTVKWNDMLSIFKEAYDDYVNKDKEKDKCKEADADLERWYESSKNNDHLLLSFYCTTKNVPPNLHLKVSKSTKKVLQLGFSLEEFGIVETGDYKDMDIPEEDGRRKIIDFLGIVTDQITAVKTIYTPPVVICPEPGNETMYSFQRKTENGLDYYKFAISCKRTESVYPSHCTKIEIVIEQSINDGKPKLVSMELPGRNTKYIEAMEKKEGIQKEKIKDKESITTTVKSITTTVKPITTTVKRINTTVKPINTTVKPINTTVKPINTTVKPINTTVKPINTTVKPINTTVKPINTTVKPINTTAKLTDVTAKPTDSDSKYIPIIIAIVSIAVIAVVAVVIFVLLKFSFIDIHC